MVFYWTNLLAGCTKTTFIGPIFAGFICISKIFVLIGSKLENKLSHGDLAKGKNVKLMTAKSGALLGRELLKGSMKGLLYIGAFHALLENWDDMEARFLAFEDVNLLSLPLFIHIEYTYLPQNIESLLTVIDAEFFVYKSYKSPTRQLLTERETQNGMRIMRTVELMVVIAIINICLMPITIALLTVATNGMPAGMDTGQLPMPIEMANATGRANPVIYLTAFAFQVTFFLILSKTAFVLYNSGIMAMQRLTAEMKLFTLVVGEVGTLMLANNRKHCRSGKSDSYSCILELENSSELENGFLDVREFWKEIVNHHYFICRHLVLLNKGIKLVATGINQMLCLIICVSLYYFAKDQNLFSKLKNLSLLVPVFLILFAYCAIGQSLIDEGERMRSALIDWDWVGSPIWLQKTLLLMLTRSNRPFQVKPFGIFSLDLRNSAMVMKAVYSYFNILQSASINK